jgi:hypothetical protein
MSLLSIGKTITRLQRELSEPDCANGDFSLCNSSMSAKGQELVPFTNHPPKGNPKRSQICYFAFQPRSVQYINSMNAPDPISIFLSITSLQLPTLIVCLVACIVTFTKWKLGSRGSVWALSGFGLVVFLSIAIPVVQTILQIWAYQSGHQAQIRWVYPTFFIIWSVLHAVSYVFFLVAIFAGRTTPNSPLVTSE